MTNQNSIKSYPLFKVFINHENCLNHVTSVLNSGFINEGRQVQELTENLIPILGSKNIVLTNSCTSALTMAYKISGLTSKKNIVTTPMTCIATNTPIINLNGNIIWADVDPDNGMITKNSIEAKIDENTVAVAFTNWGGVLPQLEELYDFCKLKGIKLIQDAAHSFMAEYDNKSICNYADFTCFSFQAIKHFTCGDGGALIANNDLDFKKAKKLKWFGYDRDASKDENGNWKAQQEEADIEENDVGYKFNMNNISAGIGLSNIPKIRQLVDKHIENAEIYNNHFYNDNKIKPLKKVKGSKCVYWVYTLLLDPTIDKDNLIKNLNKHGISSGPVHIPNDEYSCFKRFKDDLPGVRQFSKRQLNLPCGWWLEKNDIDFIANKLKNLIYKNY